MSLRIFLRVDEGLYQNTQDGSDYILLARTWSNGTSEVLYRNRTAELLVAVLIFMHNVSFPLPFIVSSGHGSRPLPVLIDCLFICCCCCGGGGGGDDDGCGDGGGDDDGCGGGGDGGGGGCGCDFGCRGCRRGSDGGGGGGSGGCCCGCLFFSP